MDRSPQSRGEGGTIEAEGRTPRGLAGMFECRSRKAATEADR